LGGAFFRLADPFNRRSVSPGKNPTEDGSDSNSQRFTGLAPGFARGAVHRFVSVYCAIDCVKGSTLAEDLFGAPKVMEAAWSPPRPDVEFPL